MKTIIVTGLCLFLLGFSLFNAIPFWADYRLTKHTAEEKIGDEKKADLFVKHAGSVIDKTFTSTNHAGRYRHHHCRQ